MSRLVAGCDPHLETVTVAVVDSAGGGVETVTVPNSARGWEQTVELCQRWEIEVVGIEGASGFGRCLAQTLNQAGIRVREVPTRLTARLRRVDGAGKTDPGDARTIARAVSRGEGNDWTDDPWLETIRVLSVRRDHLVVDQTADINQLRALLTGIDPMTAARLGRLRSVRSFQTLTRYTTDGDPHLNVVVELIHQIATTCLDRLSLIRQLEHQLDQHMPPTGRALIDQIPGCGVVTAAQLLAQLAGTDHFATPAKMAAWAGTAPLDVSSGKQQRHRLNPGGNRQANRAIHTIITTQARHHGQAHHYINRRMSEGKTRREATRAAKRHLTRRIWKILHTTQLT